MKKILSWTAAGILSMGALAACGSDDDKSPSTTGASEVTTADDTATTAASGDDTGTTAASGESSAEVEEFCARVTELVEGPTDPEYATKLQELIASSASLLSSLTPADQATLTECTTKLTGG